jgi:UDP:flavonoid glycosyltransferase YjiC (YdhE family)
MHDLVNDFRRKVLDLPPLHTRQAIRMLIDERVPHIYCWSPSLVPRPIDWPPHINVAGYFFLKNDNNQFTPSDDLSNFLGLNNNGEKLPPPPPPPIYIGFGSITGNDSHHLLQVVLAALEKTGYRALLSGFDKENDELPENIFKIGDVPHDWLFQHGELILLFL